MRNYHFSCGNSTKGAVGLGGDVCAPTRSEALLELRRALGKLVGGCGEIRLPANGSLRYVNIYLSPENIALTDLDEDS